MKNEHFFEKRCNIIHLKENSTKKLGYQCTAYVREQGIKASKGEYIAFLDDSDIWFPYKIQMQVNMMNEYDICCTEALCGNGSFYSDVPTKKMIQEHCFTAFFKKMFIFHENVYFF